MTMPLAAELISGLDVMDPTKWTDDQVGELVRRIDDDLPGSVLAYLESAVPACQACECGALHVDIGDPALDETRRSLARVFATPFAGIIGEWTKRKFGLSGVVKFGWSNLHLVAPRFAWAVPVGSPQQSGYADKLSDLDLQTAVDAINDDLPLGFAFIRRAAESYDGSSFMATSLSPDEAGGYDQWVETIDQLMLIGATPMRKYVAEWLLRVYRIEQFGPINCCRVSFGSGDGFGERVMADQVSQQLTPDC